MSMMLGLSDGAAVAAVVLVGTLAGTLAPLILAKITNKQTLTLKQMDWAREDIITKRKEDAEEKARQQQAQIINEVVEVKKQNVIIHRLVNSAYTASLAAQLVALQGKIMYAKLGEATPEELNAIQTAIDNLQAEIDERTAQQVMIDRQLVVDADASNVFKGI